MHLYGANLAHAVCTCDRLGLFRRVELWLHEDDAVGGLDVESFTCRDDLANQHGTCRCGGELVDELLAFFGADSTGDGTEDSHAWGAIQPCDDTF